MAPNQKLPLWVIRRLKTSNARNRPFTLSYIISGSDKGVKTATYESLKSFREAFSGFQFTNPKTKFTFPPSHLLNHLDPDVVYIAEHPFLTARLEEYNHSQISDKASEQKACSALERHLNNKHIVVHRRILDDPTRPNGWRDLAGEDDIAEWEGVWIGPDGRYFFLEAKHSIGPRKFHSIQQKLIRTLDFLGVDHLKATVYLAMNYWAHDDDMVIAQKTYKFGILASNGSDLDVREPINT